MFDSQSVQGVLRAMSDAECAVCRLYRACGEQWKDDGEFWSELAVEEERHAADIGRMIEILTSRPDVFRGAKRPLNAAGIGSFVSYVAGVADQVAAGTLTKDRTLIMARDIEQSILELKHAEVAETADAEFQTLARRVNSEAVGHRLRLDGKMKQGAAAR